MSPSVDPSMSLHPTAMITQQMGQLSLGNTGPVSNSTHTNTNMNMGQDRALLANKELWFYKNICQDDFIFLR